MEPLSPAGLTGDALGAGVGLVEGEGAGAGDALGGGVAIGEGEGVGAGVAGAAGAGTAAGEGLGEAAGACWAWTGARNSGAASRSSPATTASPVRAVPCRTIARPLLPVGFPNGTVCGQARAAPSGQSRRAPIL